MTLKRYCNLNQIKSKMNFKFKSEVFLKKILGEINEKVQLIHVKELIFRIKYYNVNGLFLYCIFIYYTNIIMHLIYHRS